jgi:hypothetical protein
MRFGCFQINAQHFVISLIRKLFERKRDANSAASYKSNGAHKRANYQEGEEGCTS